MEAVSTKWRCQAPIQKEEFGKAGEMSNKREVCVCVCVLLLLLNSITCT